MLFSKDLGIDLGTANTLVYSKGEGIIINEPSVVAINTNTKEVLAVGNDAKQMIGRTPGNIVAIRPMRDGVIADFEITNAMLKHFIKKAIDKKSFFASKPRIVVCIPSGVTEVERRAVLEAVVHAGGKEKESFLIEEPMAAAIGADLPVSEPTGSMVVDIGGGTTEVAVISLGGIVTCKSLRVAGDDIDGHIITYIKKEYNLMIGERTAENIKTNIAVAFENAEEMMTLSIKGRDLLTGLPKNIEINSNEIAKSIKEPIAAIIDAIKYTLEKTPPELSADVMETGITLTGGGALLKSLDVLINQETGMPVFIAIEPLNCVARGTGVALENLNVLKNVLMTPYNKY